MNHADKLRLFHSGRYLFKPPPVCHALWTPDDWVHYIDSDGRWMP